MYTLVYTVHKHYHTSYSRYHNNVMTAPDDGGAGTGCSEDDLEGFSRDMDGLLEDEDTDKSQVGKMLNFFSWTSIWDL